jgi:hypothetical protein
MESIELRRADENDGASISQVHYRALQRYHGFYGGFLATHPIDIILDSTDTALLDPKNHFLAATDGLANHVFGFIRYQVIGEKVEEQDQPPAQSIGQPDQEESSLSSLFDPKEHLRDLWEKFKEKDNSIEVCYQKAVKGQRHYCKFEPARSTSSFETL